MQLRTMHIIVILFLTLISFSCNKIEDTYWKHLNGYYIGDFLNFDSNAFSITNDTIIFQSKPVAVIIEYNLRITDRVLVIRQINDTTKGYYCSK